MLPLPHAHRHQPKYPTRALLTSLLALSISAVLPSAPAADADAPTTPATPAAPAAPPATTPATTPAVAPAAASTEPAAPVPAPGHAAAAAQPAGILHAVAVPAPARVHAVEPVRPPHPRDTGPDAGVKSDPLAPPAEPAEPAPPADLAPTVPVSPAAQALINHLCQVRANLSDEDGPTREQAIRSLQADTDALLQALFRIPADEDTGDERRLLTLFANRLQARIQYEQNLMKIPAAQRVSVDKMLAAIPGHTGYFSGTLEERTKLLDLLIAAKPDPVPLAAFLTLWMHDKNPAIATVALERAAAAPSPEYLPVLEELHHAGYVALYLPKNLDEDGLANRLQEEPTFHDLTTWYTALINLATAIPGDRADRILGDLFLEFTDAETSVIMRYQSGNSAMLVTLADALVKRDQQALFPRLITAARTHSLLESSAEGQDGETIYSAGCDLDIYVAYRLIDKSIPARATHPELWLEWHDGKERLKFYDDFLRAWQADLNANKPNRGEIDDYLEWYTDGRTNLLDTMAQIERNRRENQENQPVDPQQNPPEPDDPGMEVPMPAPFVPEAPQPDAPALPTPAELPDPADTPAEMPAP